MCIKRKWVVHIMKVNEKVQFHIGQRYEINLLMVFYSSKWSSQNLSNQGKIWYTQDYPNRSKTLFIFGSAST